MDSTLYSSNLPSHSRTHSRFRGALLGMSLARRSDLCEPLPDLPTSDSALLTLPMLRSVVPGLLRYHDSRTRRYSWLRQQVTAKPAEVTGAALAQRLLLGDVLEVVLSFQMLPARAVLWHEMAQLKAQAAAYDLPAQQTRSYQVLLAELVQRLSVENASNPKPTDLVAASPGSEVFLHGIVSALQHLESPALSIQVAAVRDERAAAIAGLISGAAIGQSGLPAIWQISRLRTRERQIGTRDDARREGQRVRCWETVAGIVAIADKIFTQWAGLPSEI